MTAPDLQPHFTKNCMCDKYTNCTACQQHDTSIRNEMLRLVESDEWQMEHDATIRNATRNILLDDLVRWNDENRTNTQNMITRSHEWWIRRIYEEIESLRGER